MTGYLPGDLLARRKGLVTHYGVALANGRVLHNMPGRGEHVSSAAEFSRGHRVRVTPQSFSERRRTLRSAGTAVRELQAGTRRHYSLFDNNCEHTVHRVAEGEARSPQLRGWLLGAGLAAATLAVTRHPGWAAASFALGQKVARR